MTSLPKTAICIVTHNHEKTIEKCLKSARKQKGFKQEELTIFIRDNCSTDNTRQIIDHLEIENLDFERADNNSGFSRGQNGLIQKALSKGVEYVLLLNPDLALEPQALKNMIKALDAVSHYGMATPLLLSAKEDLSPLNPPIVDAAGMTMRLNIRHLDRGSGTPLSPEHLKPAEVFGGSGAALLCKKSFLKDIALRSVEPDTVIQVFDNAFFAYREDADLAWRSIRRGWQTVFVPDAIGYHVRRVTPEKRSSLPPAINAWSVRNRFLLQENNLTLPMRLISAPFRISRNIATVLIVFMREKTSLPAITSAVALKDRAKRINCELSKKSRQGDLYTLSFFGGSAIKSALFPSSETAEKIKTIGVLIINYKEEEKTIECLESVKQQRTNRKLSITLIDNSDRESMVLKEYSNAKGITYEHYSKNLGFAGAINNFANSSSDNAILILNPDIRLKEQTIEELALTLEKFENALGSAPILCGEDNKPQMGFFAQRLPTTTSLCLEASGLHKLWPSNPWMKRKKMEDDLLLEPYAKCHGENIPNELLCGPRKIEQLAAACLLLQRKALLQLGGFDEDFYPAWFEDVDLAKRAAEEDYVFALTNSTKAIHHGGYSAKILGKTKFRSIYQRNRKLYAKKHFSPIAYAIFRLADICGRSAIYLLNRFGFLREH